MLETIIILLVIIYIYKLHPFKMSYNDLNLKIEDHENRYGKFKSSLIISLVLFLILLLFTRPDTHCNYLGAFYAKLATQPIFYDYESPVGYRILTPLISYLVGLKGKLIIVTNFIITFLFILTVYRHFRNNSSQPGDALLAATALIFTLAATTSVHCGGYTDVLTYLLIFLMWVYRKKSILFFILFFLGLLNREAVVFLIPWFIGLQLTQPKPVGQKIITIIIGLGISLALYTGFRFWLANLHDIRYSVMYYLEPLLNKPLGIFNITFSYHSLGLFSIFRIFWVVPVVAGYFWWKAREKKELWLLFLMLLGVWCQLFIAQDTSRLFTLAFMIMFVSLDYLLKINAGRFRSWAFWLILINMIMPQLYTAGHKIEIWKPISYFLLTLLYH